MIEKLPIPDVVYLSPAVGWACWDAVVKVADLQLPTNSQKFADSVREIPPWLAHKPK